MSARPEMSSLYSKPWSEFRPGDEIRFKLFYPWAALHFYSSCLIYPLIAKKSVTINGYSQPGSSPNSNPILAPNNARPCTRKPWARATPSTAPSVGS